MIGVGALTQRETDPLRAVSALDMMEWAARQAASESVLSQVQLTLVPQGSWKTANAGGELAKRFGATARTVQTDLGVLQTSLFVRAIQAIQAGTDLVLIAGGEGRAREGHARRAGIELEAEPDTAGVPDEFVKPDGMVISRLEIDTGLVQAVFHYALIDNARRAANGWSMQQQSDAIADLWGGMGSVAEGYARAWNTAPPSAAELRTAEGAGRMLSTPYRKNHVTQWNVDQAQALVLASVEKAQALGIPGDQWIFPLGVAENNHMIPVSERAELQRQPAVGLAGAALAETTGVKPADADLIELYSCFPVAVAVQMDELGIADRIPTVTGGMTFGGGPYNNSVLGGAVPLIEALREAPGTALLTAVSGMLTKQGLLLLSDSPPASVPPMIDVSDDVAAANMPVPCEPPVAGDTKVLSVTVLHGKEGAERAVAVLEYSNGSRTISSSTHAEVIEAAETSETIGTQAQVDADGAFSLS